MSELDPGTLARYDQLDHWGSDLSDVVGMHFHKLTRWGVEPIHAAQMAAILQQFLQSQLEKQKANSERKIVVVDGSAEAMVMKMFGPNELPGPDEPPADARV